MNDWKTVNKEVSQQFHTNLWEMWIRELKARLNKARRFK